MTKVHRVAKVLRVQLVHRVFRDNRVHRVVRVLLVSLDHKV